LECPACGVENPKDADFCSLCYAKLKEGAPCARPTARPQTESTRRSAPASGYQSPGEWHGELVNTEIPLEEEVGRRIRNFKIRNIIFGASVLAIIVAVVLMLTVWGNPAPQQVLKDYISAITAGNETRALELMLPGDMVLNTQRVEADIARVQGIKLEDLKVKTLRTDQDVVTVTLVGGWMSGASGTRYEIKESYALSFSLLMHKGRWYMDPKGLLILPSV